uniref:ubiquitinyl hydrolase 1 n=1 Tax=Plectus sambesii TaxID=2011161 RepID=A0A914UQL9_9BILA
VTNARLNVAKGLAQAAVADSKKECHIETPSYAFTLPNLTTLPVDFRKFLEKDIIETSTLRGLEASGHLNWWTVNGVAQKLWPLATSGDGNCLLHAASLGMWGFHDRLLILRKALYLILTKGSRRHALWRRWRWQQHYANKQAGLIYSETEWRDEWTNLVRLASPQPRSKPTSTEPLDPDRIESPLPNSVIDDDDDYYPDQIYESLEEIHVFALAHVLKRPVLVVADTVLRNANGEEFAPIPFGGIYLPLECSPNECHRSPLVLCYDAAHFSALVTMQQESSANAGRAIIPITDKERRLLPVHFACDPGPDFTWWSDAADRRIAERTALTEQQKLQLICRYLDVIKIPLRRASTLGRRDPADHIPLRMQPLPRRSGSLTNIQEEMTRSSSRSKFINDLTASLRKKFMVRSRNRSLNRQSKDAADREKAAREESQTAGTKTKTRESARKLPLSAAELRDVNCLVGAQLHTEAHHQYMEEMVKNYLRSARQRFDAEQARRTAPGANGAGRISNAPTRRERISRSFSASSIVVSCMNGDCEQQASHATNFLCSDCFR